MNLFRNDKWYTVEADGDQGDKDDKDKEAGAGSVQATSMKDLFKADNFIIPMDAQWKNFFDAIVLILTTWSCISMMFIVCFNEEMSTWMENLDVVVTVFFALDFVFNFFQEYPDRETFQRVRNHYKIAMRYLRGMAVFDFLATFPFDLFFSDG